MNVLFVCPRNCAISVMAGSILKSVSGGRFTAFSAGDAPDAAVIEQVTDFLADHHMPADRVDIKSIADFRAAEAPKIDFVISVCPAKTTEELSGLPGDPFVAHWNIETADDMDARRSEELIRDSFWALVRRIRIFSSLPQGKLASRRQLEQRARALEYSP
ncbi:MAG: arsenate reductase ArsC [Betaproteobacteria bacterium]|nr:arsenate reductase ArsC [Betaproteobacteria bacterium]